MVVYQALSAYQILECIEHKEEYHLGEEAVLILGTYIVEKYSNYKQIEHMVSLIKFTYLNLEILVEQRNRL